MDMQLKLRLKSIYSLKFDVNNVKVSNLLNMFLNNEHVHIKFSTLYDVRSLEA